MMKKLMIGLAALIVIVGIGAYFMWANIDHIIKVAVERYGSAATQSEVSLGGVTLELASGQGSLNGFRVANPKGFSSGTALSVGSIAVQLDTSSLRGSGPIVIRSVAIDKPQVIYELADNGASNLQTIANNTRAYAAAMSGPQARNETTNSNGPGRKIVIDDLVVRGGEVSVSQTMLKGRSLSAPLPVIRLTNIGKASGGATAAQVADEVLGVITREASQVAASQFTGQLTGAVKGAVGGAVKDVGGVGGQLKSLIGQ
ncbi:MAG TPA: hypothetical protein VMV79_07560 [Alphaproteobacteria bacterium]|nr:hypothetical protein [Alphaproteobacteria bacterium]